MSPAEAPYPLWEGPQQRVQATEKGACIRFRGVKGIWVTPGSTGRGVEVLDAQCTVRAGFRALILRDHTRDAVAASAASSQCQDSTFCALSRPGLPPPRPADGPQRVSPHMCPAAECRRDQAGAAGCLDPSTFHPHLSLPSQAPRSVQGSILPGILRASCSYWRSQDRVCVASVRHRALPLSACSSLSDAPLSSDLLRA